MAVLLAETLFSSTSNIVNIDSLSIDAAKERFAQFQEAGVIKTGFSFEDDTWQTTDQYSNIGLYFDFNPFAYKKYEPVFNLPFEQFTAYVKAFALSLFGKNVLN